MARKEHHTVKRRYLAATHVRELGGDGPHCTISMLVPVSVVAFVSGIGDVKPPGLYSLRPMATCGEVSTSK